MIEVLALETIVIDSESEPKNVYIYIYKNFIFRWKIQIKICTIHINRLPSIIVNIVILVFHKTIHLLLKQQTLKDISALNWLGKRSCWWYVCLFLIPEINFFKCNLII